MNQSQPCTAARALGGAPSRVEAFEDPGGRSRSDLVDKLPHLGDAADALHQLAIGKRVLVDQLEEGLEASRS